MSNFIPAIDSMKKAGWKPVADEAELSDPDQHNWIRGALYKHKSGAKLVRSSGAKEYFVVWKGRTPFRVYSYAHLKRLLQIGPLDAA